MTRQVAVEMKEIAGTMTSSPCADAEGFERHLERDGAVHRAQPVAAMLKCGELLFESRDDRMISAPAIARENFVQKFAFARSGNRPGWNAPYRY